MSPFFRKKKKTDELKVLAHNIDIYIRTLDSKLQQITSEYSVLLIQHEEIIKLLKEKKK